MLSRGSTSTGTPARAIASATSQASCPPARVFQGVVEHAADPLGHAGPRATALVLRVFIEVGYHPDRRFHEHLVDRAAIEVDEHRLTADEVPLWRREHGGDPFHARDRDERRGRVD